MKKISADLHIHTSYSDGVFSPEEVIKKASDLGLRAVAITDHDCIDGVSEALAAAAATDIEVVPGVEMSVFIEDKEAHLIGYFINTADPKLIGYLESFKTKRLERIKKMLSLLTEQGIDIPLGLLKPNVNKGSIGRLNLAKALVASGVVGSVKEAFDRYIGTYKNCYVQHEKMPYDKCIDLIKKNGGVPVLAHPGTIKDTACIQKCISAGIKGLEVYHPKHKPHQVLKYENIARENGLICTGGSDCHGISIKNGLLLGTVTVNYHTVEKLKQEAGRS